MTFRQIVLYVDALRPNPFEESTKLSWLCEADGLVRAEVLGQSASLIPQSILGTDTPVVSSPYVRLYSYYLLAMIDLFSSDYDRYKISSQMFEDAMQSYAKKYQRTGEI